jgi:hypothetical protein
MDVGDLQENREKLLLGEAQNCGESYGDKF